VPNPLPIDPAARALGLGQIDELRVQLFQSAGCNWRCWYCFVPFELLSASRRHSNWIGIGEMLDMMSATGAPKPGVIVLSGGEPGLTPEWAPWLLAELKQRGIDRRVYLWSDDNLSTDYFWRFLTSQDQEFVASHPNYGRVACFKGFDRESFQYNTNADGRLFETQLSLMKRLVATGMDLYSYVTLTSARAHDIAGRIRLFVDRLQAIDENLPLRTVPLEVRVFTPVEPRLTEVHRLALKNQWLAVDAWTSELANRFSTERREMNVVDVPFASRD
jgi:uncharacterized Fe-S cluster-containing radical SAM superfamily protein